MTTTNIRTVTVALWQSAPDWARYYTVDERGAAYWWEDKPHYSGVRWWSFTGRTTRADNNENGTRCEERTAEVTQMTADTRTVTIPACSEHEGYPGYAIKVVLEWVCPICNGPRGEPSPTISYDGSRRLDVDGWENPCGHIDKYVDVRDEMRANGLNPQYATPEMQS